MNYKASIIISVYRNISALNIVLDSLRNQTEKNFEIIVSEDSEYEEMKRYLSTYPFENDYQHLTHEDKGWRKTKALNNAIRHAKADWLIFVDGDCMLHPRFVEMHVHYADEHTILSGRRVKLNEKSTKKIEQQPDFKLRGLFSKLFFKQIFGISKTAYLEEGFFFPPTNPLHFIAKKRRTSYILGCNMSFSKQAIYAINGFDECFTEPSVGEDTDIAWRFKAAGYQIKSLRNLAIQYHLHHPQNWMYSQKNHDIMEANKAKNLYVCQKGLTI